MRKSLSKIALATFAILFTLANTAFAQCNATLFAGGTGTAGNPYQISTAEQLQNLNKCLGSDYKDNYYVLNNNIDLTSYLSGAGNNSGAGWQPIGILGSGRSFRGKFNGNGYKVSGFWINRPSESYIGLFGIVENTTIMNIGLEIDNAKGGVNGKDCVGGLTGCTYDITISNSYAIGSVTGSSSVGSLVGGNNGCDYGDCILTISNSYATGSVNGSDGVGGLVGYSCGYSSCTTTISGSHATGNVTGSNNVGGLIGHGGQSSTISNSYATGSVTGSGNVGGLVGYSCEFDCTAITISDSYATGSVTGSSNVGGLVGIGGGTISNCHATGKVSGSSNYVGGLVGDVGGGTISNCHATGKVTGTKERVGGLVGENSSLISNSYATGDVSGSGNFVGGLVGHNYGEISSSYATGNVTGEKEYIGGLTGSNRGGIISNSYAIGNVEGNSGWIGGLVGTMWLASSITNCYAVGSVAVGGGLVGYYDDGTITNSYYNINTSGKTDEGKGEGKSTAAMKAKNTYTNWDFVNIWAISDVANNGYPILRWQLRGTIDPIPPQRYTGSAIKPDFTITLNEKVLTSGIHYTFSYSNNVNVGTAKIHITFIGDYENLGSTEAYFEIISTTPIISNKNPKIGSIIIQAIPNAILLSNLPRNTKIEVYTLQGKQIRSANSGNSQILKILVQTKGMYIVKAGSQTERVMVR